MHNTYFPFIWAANPPTLKYFGGHAGLSIYSYFIPTVFCKYCGGFLRQPPPTTKKSVAISISYHFNPCRKG